ncbi:DHH family phosphoesterase, partial [Methanocaldococcus sp.]
MKLENIKKMEKVAKLIKDKILESENIKIITHHDTDGLSSGAILVKTLFRSNKLFHLKVVEHLSPNVINKVINDNSLYIFADMGSGQINRIIEKDVEAIILDHHPPIIKEEIVNNKIIQLNPHIYGFDGAKEITASGVCYFVAREFNYYNLSQFAIVGMIGD